MVFGKVGKLGNNQNLVQKTENFSMKLCIITRSVIKGDGQGRANYEIVWEAIRRQHQIGRAHV